MAFPFLRLPNEIRLMIYQLLFLFYPFHMYAGLVQSCSELHSQTGKLLVKLTGPLLNDIQRRWNARLRWPLQIRMPVNVAQLRRITLFIDSRTIYNMALNATDFDTYLQVIRRIILLGSLRPGFPSPSRLPSSPDRIVYTIEGVNGGNNHEIERDGTGAKGFGDALKHIRDRPTRHDWSVTVSTDHQNGGYQVHFGIKRP